MNAHFLLPAIAVAAFTCGSAVNAVGEPLHLHDVSAVSAAAQLESKYGIVLRLENSPAMRVNIDLDEADAPGSRLEAVNALANELDVDFTKVYLVTKEAGTSSVQVRVDSTATLPFAKTTLAVRDAIERVAAADDATADIADDVIGTVTLSRTTLSASDAAVEIASRTHTRWVTEYVLSPRGQNPASGGGTVVGYTNGGSPIVEMSFVRYVDPAREAQRKQDLELAEQQEAAMEQQVLAQQQALAQRQGLSRQTPAGGGGQTTNGGSQNADNAANNGSAEGSGNGATNTGTTGGLGWGGAPVPFGASSY